MYVGVNRAHGLFRLVVRVFPMYVGVNRRPLVECSRGIVFPMYVGVNRHDSGSYSSSGGIPHVCGGEPAAQLTKLYAHVYSPCMWG